MSLIDCAAAPTPRRPLTGTSLLLCCLLIPAASDAQVRPKAFPADRLTSDLRTLVEALATSSPFGAAARAPVSRGVEVAVSVTHDGNMEPLRTFILSIGGTVQTTVGNTTEAYVPVSALMRLGRLAGVRRVAPIRPPAPLVTSEAVGIHNASNWQSVGISGAPVRVGIIDGGFAGYAALIGSELPVPAAVRCYYGVGLYSSNLNDCGTGGSQHGTAVAEALVDVAPGVTVLLANPISRNDLYSTVQWMISQGVQIINHSGGWSWDGPGDGTSPSANSPLAAVNAAVAAGILWVNAAGNEASSQTWTAAYADADGDGWIETSGADESNYFYAAAGERVQLQVRWQDSWIASRRDLDVYVYDSRGFLVAGSADYQLGRPGDQPSEWIAFSAPYSDTFRVRIAHYAGAPPSWVQLQTWTRHFLRYASPSYSIANPAESASPGLLAVGASNTATPFVIAPYSSQGPTMDGRVKPDIVGVDRGDSASLGPWSGTSQAAPHVAGLAALVLSRWHWLTPADLANYLKASAQPRGVPVPNHVWGSGLAYLPAAVACAYTVSPLTFARSSAAGSVEISVAAPAGCEWSASSSAGWLVITGGAAGVGDGTVTVSIAENPLTFGRTGPLTIAGHVVTFSQSENRQIVLERRWASPSVQIPHDYDGDNRADVAVVRSTTGQWLIARSAGGVDDVSWGAPALQDVPVPGDYDGDGRADVASYRRTAGEWFILGSSSGFMRVDWGAPILDDIPVPADYDGDGRVDVAVYRRSSGEWLLNRTSAGPITISWGAPALGDVPVPGDYDGDGQDDVAVYRPSTGQWFILLSQGGSRVASWGAPSLGDRPVPADYDGDGQTDIGIYRESTGQWIIARSTDGLLNTSWGAPHFDDVPVAADYDGDGKADLAVYRASTGMWFIAGSAGAAWTVSWGSPDAGDYVRGH